MFRLNCAKLLTQKGILKHRLYNSFTFQLMRHLISSLDFVMYLTDVILCNKAVLFKACNSYNVHTERDCCRTSAAQFAPMTYQMLTIAILNH